MTGPSLDKSSIIGLHWLAKEDCHAILFKFTAPTSDLGIEGALRRQSSVIGELLGTLPKNHQAHFKGRRIESLKTTNGSHLPNERMRMAVLALWII